MNNAGLGSSSVASGPAEWLKPEDFAHIMNINLYGMVRVTNAFLPLLKKTRGRIVNMSSVMGRLAIGAANYVTSKYAVEGYSDCIRWRFALRWKS